MSVDIRIFPRVGIIANNRFAIPELSKNMFTQGFFVCNV